MAAEAMTREGFLEHRGHQVWWGSVGDEHDGVPVLTLHGGPGICHDCLEPLTALGDSRRVVFYDQYGCGRSDRAADPQEYDVALFVDEVSSVREALGLDEVHLYAHSYGGPIALQYVLDNPRAGVRSLVLSNTFASVPELARGWARRMEELPAAAREALTGGSAPGSPEYGAALGAFVESFVLATAPPDALVRSQLHSGGEVYARMHGPSWFVPDGEWADWDVTARLGEISVPTLVIGGTRDQVVPELAQSIHEQVPTSELKVLEAAHLPFYERPEEYVELLADFLSRTEAVTHHRTT